MNKFTVPDICDEFGETIQICDLFLNSFGKNDKFFGQVELQDVSIQIALSKS